MLFQTLDKLKRQSILASIILAVLGIVLLICPAGYIHALVVTAGYVMIIFAIVQILEFIAGKKALIHYITFTGALVIAVFGAFVLIYSENVLRGLGWLFGLVLVQDGVFSLINALIFARRSDRKGWWVLILLAALLAAFGVLIFVNPWWDTPSGLAKVIGGALLFSSLASALRLIWAWPFKDEKGEDEDAAE